MATSPRSPPLKDNQMAMSVWSPLPTQVGSQLIGIARMPRAVSPMNFDKNRSFSCNVNLAKVFNRSTMIPRCLYSYAGHYLPSLAIQPQACRISATGKGDGLTLGNAGPFFTVLHLWKEEACSHTWLIITDHCACSLGTHTTAQALPAALLFKKS